MGAYELPIAEKMLFSFSYTDDQNSVYGDMPIWQNNALVLVS
jgi:outer membrane receptor for ferrienterochelin and colicins